MAKDYYKILGVEKDASLDKIKKAYRKLAKEHHPDLHKGNKENEEKLKDINEAYAVLSNKEKRQQYDQFGSTEGGFNFKDFSSGFGGFGGGGVHVDYEDVGDIEDIFENFFTGFGGRSPFGARRRQGPVKGEDLIFRLNLSFRESVFGCKKQIFINVKEKCSYCNGTGAKNGIFSTCTKCNGTGKIREQRQTIFGSFSSISTCSYCGGIGKIAKEKCSYCNGRGLVLEKKQITVNIPEGVDNGYKIRLSGKGNAGKKGGPNGDLYILLFVEEDEVFERKGNNIYNTIHIPVTAAILGGKVKIPTLGGYTNLKIPNGTQSGTKFVLKNKGVLDPQTRFRGNQIIKVIVDIPKKLSNEQIKHIKELANLETKYDHVKHNETLFEKLEDLKEKFF